MFLIRKLYGGYALLAFTVCALPTWCVVALCPGIARRRAAARAGARAFFALAGLRLTVSGTENLPTDPCVVAANHASYLDGVLLTAVLPPRFAFVIKNGMEKVPLAGSFLRRIDAQFVERGNSRRSAADARRMLRTAAAQNSIGIFPEGTFAKEPGLRTFRAGGFRVAARQELPVVPTVITGTRTVLPDGVLLPRPGRIRVEICAPLASSDAAELTRNTRRRILERLGEPDLNPAQSET